MLLVDANVLLYAVNGDSAQHASAREWLDGALAGDEPVGFAESVVLAFLRVATHPAIFPAPLTLEQACRVVEDWLRQSTAVTPLAGEQHAARVCGSLARVGTGGNLVNDAHLAALAAEHDATIVTFDHDFARLDVSRLRILEGP